MKRYKCTICSVFHVSYTSTLYRFVFHIAIGLTLTRMSSYNNNGARKRRRDQGRDEPRRHYDDDRNGGGYDRRNEPKPTKRSRVEGGSQGVPPPAPPAPTRPLPVNKGSARPNDRPEATARPVPAKQPAGLHPRFQNHLNSKVAIAKLDIKIDSLDDRMALLDDRIALLRSAAAH